MWSYNKQKKRKEERKKVTNKEERKKLINVEVTLEESYKEHGHADGSRSCGGQRYAVSILLARHT